MTRAQVKHIFDSLLGDYAGSESEVMVVDSTIFLNSVGAAFRGPSTYDSSTGLLMMNGNTWVRAEQIAALQVHEVRAIR
jgi:hypothetical protein